MELIAVSVGNTRTKVGLFRGAELQQSVAVENTSPGAVAVAVESLPLQNAGAPVVMASVNDPFAQGLVEELERTGSGRVYRMGRDLPMPVVHTLGDASGVGQDRLLNALGAFSRARQACVVIDAGTAVCVDFVDGQGVFHGGAIAPGLNLMLRALHEGTAALPMVRYEPPAQPAEPFGKDTRGAMLRGVRAAVKGMARHLIDEYAEFYQAYPQVIATGGDARALFEGDELIEHIVPDLTLLGIQAACAMTLEAEGEEEGEGDGEA